MPVYMNRNSVCVLTYRPTRISLANTLLIVPYHVLYYFKGKLNSCQHYLLKSKSNITNLISHIAYICLSDCSLTVGENWRE
jgi:hypothetical protein